MARQQDTAGAGRRDMGTAILIPGAPAPTLRWLLLSRHWLVLRWFGLPPLATLRRNMYLGQPE